MNTSRLSVRRATALLAATLLSALAIVALTSMRTRANADPYPPSQGCSVSSDITVSGGDTLVINGSGFKANTLVALTVDHSTPLNSVTSNGSGTFSDTVTIPSSITGSNHNIWASADGMSCAFNPFGGSGVAGITAERGVGGVSTTRGIAGVSTERGLASTGFATLTASVIAVVLLGGGVLLVVLGRRRAQR